MKALSLFSGAMGLDLGLEASGIETAGCIDMMASAVATVRLNRPNLPTLRGDISKLGVGESLAALGLDARGVDLICGGPPCQPYSTIGKREGAADSRSNAMVDFVRFVGVVRPKFFVLENVRGFLNVSGCKNTTRGGMFREIAAALVGAGYAVDAFLVNSANYGCAQTRERVVVVGNRLGFACAFPKPTHGPGLLPYRTLQQALATVSPEETALRVMDFSPRKKRYLACVPPGDNWRSLPTEMQMESMGKAFHAKGGRSAWWRRLSWDAPCPTLVTMPNHASTSLCHPDEVRALSIAEYAAIQGFPSDWRFGGTTAEIYRQIGNAVPLALGEAAGRAVSEMARTPVYRPQDMPVVTVTHLSSHVRVNSYVRAGLSGEGVP